MAGRYRLIDLLGEGANGQVWRARDELLGEDVAVKLVAAISGPEIQRARREAVALRWARLPGVVGLRDDGRLGESWFLVMDLVKGRPFPGEPGPSTWEQVGPVARRMLEVLAGLHAAGVVHRDLKPANVLVVPGAGEVVLVDLGLAIGRPVDRAAIAGHFAGTARYAAPEQIVGQPLDGRTDLYAFGVMLYEALSGGFPHHGSDGVMRLLARRLREPAPPLRSVAPEVPAEVAQVVDALLRRERDERPASAWEVLRALGGRLPAPLSGELALPEDRPATEDELRSLFHGPDHFLHLREDAAAALWARTGGHAPLVREELGTWLRVGLGVWDQGAVRMDRNAIERLMRGERVGVELPGVREEIDCALALAFPDAGVDVVARALARDPAQVQERVDHLVRAGRAWPLSDGRIGCRPMRGAQEAPVDALRRTLAAALPHRHPGRVRLLAEAGASAGELALVTRAVLGDPELPPAEALVVVERALQVARAEGEARVEESLLRELAAAALLMEAPGPLRYALYEVERGLAAGLELEEVEALLRGVLGATTGDLPQARSELARVPQQGHEELEMWRVGGLVYLARFDGAAREVEVLDGFAAWAGHSQERTSRVHGWWGNLFYRQGRYAEAAERHLAAAASKQREISRVSSLANAVAALLEVPAPEQAWRRAEEALVRARQARAARLEVKLQSLLLAAAYRADRSPPSDLGLVADAALVREHEAATISLVQAAHAWRVGSPHLARELARLAVQHADRCGHGPTSVLAGALLVELEGARPPGSPLEARVGALEDEVLRAQALFLLGRRQGRADLLDEARRLARVHATRCPGRLDLLSLDEILNEPAPSHGA